MFPWIKGLAGFAAAVLCLLGASAATVFAQANYPNRPIRLVVPVPPGGGIDTFARTLTRQLEGRLGMIVVDNRGGANGIIGADLVAKAPPDGYTLLSHSFAFVINPAMYKQLPYDTEKDFYPITNYVNGLGYLLSAHPSVAARNVTAGWARVGWRSSIGHSVWQEDKARAGIDDHADATADQRAVDADELQIAANRLFHLVGDGIGIPAAHGFGNQLHDLVAMGLGQPGNRAAQGGVQPRLQRVVTFDAVAKRYQRAA